tara:strand:- start:1034 stop:1873 length:840 start_codon:yes stop_codon:yes gene_type:complete
MEDNNENNKIKNSINNIVEIDKKDKINLCQKLSSFKRTGDDLVNNINSIISSWDDIILKKKQVIATLNKDIDIVKKNIANLRNEFKKEQEDIIAKFNSTKDHWKTLVNESKKFKIDKIVKINVGGYKFVTSKSMFDNCYLTENFLTTMFSGVWEPNKDDQDHYFIDRDGKYFEHILNYLRDQEYQIVLKSLDITVKKALYVEANYFRINELLTILRNYIYQGDELINERVRIYWEKEDKWFIGTIYKYCKYDKKHFVKYDDGEQKSYSLINKRWELLRN